MEQINTELLEALRALTDWGREHTSPQDANSPHALLVRAVAVIAKADAYESDGCTICGRKQTDCQCDVTDITLHKN